ncbi:Protein kri1 [Erysiphe neolycopersici]|uniref:Protein kri1 n=1 Tax=Erysiphe neolycopersici TaxID=212602 RepID=A0A420HJV6_9PEZI|nr:Protein kri1 [Erysiphe neolycopersici]
MSKRKATMASHNSPYDSKRLKKYTTCESARPRLLDESSSEDESDGGVKLLESSLTVNENFAKKYEYNKKREERQKLEEKLNKNGTSFNKTYGDKYDEDSESSNDEEEDDVGLLATETLDAEISATLQAIRSKDPVVYDENFSFYKHSEENQIDTVENEIKKSKPMYLRDYHRENLLKEKNHEEDEDKNPAPQTFAKKQEELQKSIIKEIHDTGNVDSENDDGVFLVPKSKPESKSKSGTSHESAAEQVVDIAIAEKDPEKFLSNFLAARAWIPNDQSRFQPLESDDESEEERAEKFESAYNLRFEDPTGSNEALKSYSRKIVASKSVRREEKKSRKRQRDNLREKRELERKQLEEERIRLKRLKAEEVEDRVKMIKKAAGIHGKSLSQDEIFRFLDDAWDNEKWTDEMSKLFGDEYYAIDEVDSENNTGSKEEEEDHHKKKVKKPKWDDDIEIDDILPDFQPEVAYKRQSKLSEPNMDLEITEDERNGSTKQDVIQAKKSEKKTAKLERKRIEELVENHLDVSLLANSKQLGRFHYRETSPVSFGLTPQDILMAPDTSLNQFVGLKKLASFRDPTKKRRDKKLLGKKARLRQWRTETFRSENGPEIVIAPNIDDKEESSGLTIVEGARKKKTRSRKKKKQAEQDNL